MSKVAILTNFMEFNPGYSLTGIVKDQARMLTRYGHDVHLFVNDQYHGEAFSEDVTLRKLIPFAHLKDYRTRKDLTSEHKMTVQGTAAVLKAELKEFDFAFSHDFVFTGWFMPYGLGCMEAGRALPNLRWLHWLHSVPSLFSDWWNIREYGPRHKLIFPNEIDRLRVAENYHGEISDVRVMPHIKDLRSWFDFGEDTCSFIDDFPGVMQHDVVKVYPASSDRLHAKGIREIILILSKLKKRGFSVFCVVANQWATGTQPRQDIEHYKRMANRNGLKMGTDFVFTSEWGYEKRLYENGIPKKMLRELFQCSNLFIFPTREESFGLVAPEAALAGGVLMVLNKSLSMMFEVMGFSGLYLDFGSYHQTFKPENEDAYFNEVASIILGRMKQNETINSKTFVRKKYNWDSLYLNAYQPVMAEAATWA